MLWEVSDRGRLSGLTYDLITLIWTQTQARASNFTRSHSRDIIVDSTVLAVLYTSAACPSFRQVL